MKITASNKMKNWKVQFNENFTLNMNVNYNNGLWILKFIFGKFSYKIKTKNIDEVLKTIEKGLPEGRLI